MMSTTADTVFSAAGSVDESLATPAALTAATGTLHQSGMLVRELKALGKIVCLLSGDRGAVVAMIGDGINDAPVLAQAQVSIALASGTRQAQTSADMVLMSAQLDVLLGAVRVARRTMRIIRQNLAWAVAYNAIALPLAVLGYVTPLVAAVGMSLSSLTVVLNALRLL